MGSKLVKEEKPAAVITTFIQVLKGLEKPSFCFNLLFLQNNTLVISPEKDGDENKIVHELLSILKAKQSHRKWKRTRKKWDKRELYSLLSLPQDYSLVDNIVPLSNKCLLYITNNDDCLLNWMDFEYLTLRYLYRERVKFDLSFVFWYHSNTRFCFTTGDDTVLYMVDFPSYSLEQKETLHRLFFSSFFLNVVEFSSWMTGLWKEKDKHHILVFVPRDQSFFFCDYFANREIWSIY